LTLINSYQENIYTEYYDISIINMCMVFRTYSVTQFMYFYST